MVSLPDGEKNALTVWAIHFIWIDLQECQEAIKLGQGLCIIIQSLKRFVYCKFKFLLPAVHRVIVGVPRVLQGSQNTNQISSIPRRSSAPWTEALFGFLFVLNLIIKT